MANETARSRLQPRLRVMWGEEVALGPGKVDLLALIAETGSIRASAERMGMSYMRAWKLVQTMNACFNEPLVLTDRGGRAHGGAVLTKTGREALEIYQVMERDFAKATRRAWTSLQSLLRADSTPAPARQKAARKRLRQP
jgi:molybdate transport system regulatory protein